MYKSKCQTFRERGTACHGIFGNGGKQIIISAWGVPCTLICQKQLTDEIAPSFVLLLLHAMKLSIHVANALRCCDLVSRLTERGQMLTDQFTVLLLLEEQVIGCEAAN